MGARTASCFCVTSLLARQPACIKRWNTTRNEIVRSATTLWFVVVPRRMYRCAVHNPNPAVHHTWGDSLSLSVGGVYGIYTNDSILSQKGSETGFSLFPSSSSVSLVDGWLMKIIGQTQGFISPIPEVLMQPGVSCGSPQG